MINFGVLGAGAIAEKFVSDLKMVPQAKCVAAYGRNLMRVTDFCTRHQVDMIYDDLDAFLNDPGIDVVYVATPHSLHAEGAVLALQAGKHVICEKPFSMNKAEAEAVFRLAQSKGLFIMEALWTLFLPSINRALKWIEAGEIGEIKAIEANFGFVGNNDPNGRLLNPALGGGALLDVGIYPVLISNRLMNGVPKQIRACAKMTDTHVDGTTSMILTYENGVMATLNASIETQMVNSLRVYGERGYVELPSFWMADEAYCHLDSKTLSFKADPTENQQQGYHHEASALCEDLISKKTQNDKVPHQFTLNLMETLDRIRKEIGLVYQMDMEV